MDCSKKVIHMTVIVGLVDDGDVWIAGDSFASKLNVQTAVTQPKVFVKYAELTEQAFVFGFCDSFRVCQLIQHGLSVPALPEDMDEYEWAVNIFVPTIINFLRDNALRFNKDNMLAGVDFLFGVNGRLFSVDPDFAVLENINGYSATGIGVEFALGSLYTTDGSSESPESRLELAVRAAAEFCVGVGLPVSIVSTKDDSVEFSAD